MTTYILQHSLEFNRKTFLNEQRKSKLVPAEARELCYCMQRAVRVIRTIEKS